MLSGGQYSSNKKIRFKTPKLSSDLCAYSDAYIAVKGRISVKTLMMPKEEIKG